MCFVIFFFIHLFFFYSNIYLTLLQRAREREKKKIKFVCMLFWSTFNVALVLVYFFSSFVRQNCADKLPKNNMRVGFFLFLGYDFKFFFMKRIQLRNGRDPLTCRCDNPRALLPFLALSNSVCIYTTYHLRQCLTKLEIYHPTLITRTISIIYNN